MRHAGTVLYDLCVHSNSDGMWCVQAELAPIDLWLRFAVEYYKQGRSEQFKTLLQPLLELEQQVDTALCSFSLLEATARVAESQHTRGMDRAHGQMRAWLVKGSAARSRIQSRRPPTNRFGVCAEWCGRAVRELWQHEGGEGCVHSGAQCDGCVPHVASDTRARQDEETQGVRGGEEVL